MTTDPEPVGLGGRMSAAAYLTGWRIARAVPQPVALGAFRHGADVATRRDGRRVRQLRANLARVAAAARPAELDELVRDAMRSYARYWCEVFRLPAMDPVEIHARMDPFVSGVDSCYEALAAGRGVVFALPHSGNWDVAGVWMVQTLRRLGRPPVLTTVAQRLRPESLFRRFTSFRERLGFEMLTAGEDAVGTHRALTRRLRAGGVVCLVSDRDLTANGIDVSFFGEHARFPPGPARLAALTGALLVPAFPRFTPGGWALPMAPPVPVPDRAAVPGATRAVADALATLIATAPADWHMLQPLWTADLHRAPQPVQR